MVKSEDKLGREKIWKLCLTMGIPCVFAQVVNLLYNIVDRIYIGNADASGFELAGLGLCAPIITLISAFSSFVSGGGAPLAAKALGEQNADKAKKYLNNGFVILVAFSVILGLLTFIFKEQLLLLVGADKATTYSHADNYLSIYLIGTVFVQLSVGLNTFITAQGKSALAMISVLIGAILNIALDPLFIFVFNMGISGAAIATVLSQAASAIFVVLVLLNKNATLRLDCKFMRLNKKIVSSTFAIGLASFVMAATESVIGFALNGRLKYYGDKIAFGEGDKYISTLTVLQSSMMLISVPVSGFTQGAMPILSYNFGAKNKQRLKQCFYVCAAVCLGYCGLFAGIMMLLPTPFGRMFTTNAEILTLTQKYLPIFVAGMLIFGIQRACQTTFVAMTEAKISLFIAVLRKIILLVPLAFILPTFMGVGGVFWAECIADSLAATCCGIIFFFRFRKILKNM